jgi:KDO2-lipid IV(A) lauroyltransferase
MGKRRKNRNRLLSQTLDVTEWLAVRSLVGAFNAVGERGAIALAGALGKAAFRLGIRRRVVLENLAIAFGDTHTAEELEDLAQQTYLHWANTIAEWAKTWGRDPGDLLERGGSVEGEGPVREALAQGRGVIVVTAHFGQFELMPLYWAHHYGPVNVVIRPLDNPLLDSSLHGMRSRYGCRVLARRGIVHNAIRCLRAGEMVGMLIDQNMTRREGVFVDFFGRPACTTPLPALLALRTDAAVFPGFAFREGPFKHRGVIGPEIPTIKTGDLQADLEVNTARYTKVIEEAIRSHPDHWFWMHRRWKTQPDTEKARGGAPVLRGADSL